ncbi:MAG: ATP-binding cassette domain-containing protein [Verrucomicrobiae bacterium]|nr:ATP-binding cassette domain-containing protein [Verrucomicrobiae bacterium]
MLSIEGLSKRFCRDLHRSLWYGLNDIAREVTATRDDVSSLRPGEFWALNDVSFDVLRGQCVGIVGSNGAGKTTLLRIVSGLIKPDVGRVTVNGVTAPLLALGAGFNPILTGRENIQINMAILGASREHVRKSFDSVVDFAELSDAIDAPLATYSSGMSARLGFACAIHVQPELLIVDEVLSVGDMRFRAKCYRRLAELRSQGTSILLVSHNSGAILGICDRVAYLRGGRLEQIGEAPAVMRRFENDLFGQETVATAGEFQLDPNRAGQGSLSLRRIFLTDGSGERVKSFTPGHAGSINLEVNAREAHQGVAVHFIVRDVMDQERVILNISSDRDSKNLTVDAGLSTISLNMPMIGLRPGNYMAKIGLSGKNFYVLDAVEAFQFTVVSELNFTSNTYYQERDWCVHAGGGRGASLLAHQAQ